MSGKIVLMGQKKGGVGKSFTAYNAAGVIANQGKSVCIVDADKNQSLFNAVGRRNKYSEKIEQAGHEPVPYIQCVSKDSEDTLTRELQQLAMMYDFVFVDTGGMENDAFKSAIPVADKIFLPFQACRADLEQLAPTIKVIMDIERYVQVTNPDYKIDARVLCALTLHNDRELFVEALETVKSLLPYVSVSGSVIKFVKKVRKLQDFGLTLSDVKDTKRAQYELFVDEILDLRRPRYERGISFEQAMQEATDGKK